MKGKAMQCNVVECDVMWCNMFCFDIDNAMLRDVIWPFVCILIYVYIYIYVIHVRIILYYNISFACSMSLIKNMFCNTGFTCKIYQQNCVVVLVFHHWIWDDLHWRDCHASGQEFCGFGVQNRRGWEGLWIWLPHRSQTQT